MVIQLGYSYDYSHSGIKDTGELCIRVSPQTASHFICKKDVSLSKALIFSSPKVSTRFLSAAVSLGIIRHKDMMLRFIR